MKTKKVLRRIREDAVVRYNAEAKRGKRPLFDDFLLRLQDMARVALRLGVNADDKFGALCMVRTIAADAVVLLEEHGCPSVDDEILHTDSHMRELKPSPKPKPGDKKYDGPERRAKPRVRPSRMVLETKTASEEKRDA